MRKFYLPLYSCLNALFSSPASRIIGTSRAGFRWIAVAALFLMSTTSYASHLAGGELTYQWISGTTYQFTATFYRDCAGINAPTTLPFSYKSVLCGISGSATMNLVAGTGQPINFNCGANSTTCNGGTNPGFQEWQYTVTVNVGARCSDWVFSWISTARNNAITTIQNPGSDNMYIDATLNNVTDTSASSPFFSNFPVALLCVGQSFTYNQGALDTLDPNHNQDSLAYSFIAPSIGPGDSVTYISPYSSVNPIASSPPASINPVNGNIILNPTTIQVGVTTVLVKKYRNGVLVGSVIRDMEFITMNCGANNLPTASGVNGSNIYADTICAAGLDTVCFNILGMDPDALQKVKLSWNGGISGATFTVTGDSTATPVGTFCWKPTYADASSTPHTFTVTVRDNYCPNNGVQVYSYSILVPPIIVTPSILVNIACNGGTGSAGAVASGGIAPYTYAWSNGSTTSSASGLLASTTYTVVATDNHGCTNSNTISLTQPLAITASVSSQTNVSCNGGNNGSATITESGGTGGLTNHWSNGQTTITAINLIAGTYTDTVIDANGCKALVPVTITQPNTLSASITSQQNVSCRGLANGQITVTVSGGTRPYSYSWSPSVGTDSTVTGLSANSYTVTITDTLGCSISKTDSVTQPGALVNHISNLTITGGIISCFGATNGVLSVLPSGGTAPYTYVWSTGQTTDTITGIGAGTYSVLVTDSNFCTADTSFTLTQPDSLIATIPVFSVYSGGYNITCNGNNDGFINLTVTGGTPGFQFAWSSGQTTQNLDSLVAGTYSVLVTDTNGCTATASITLIQPAPLAISETFKHNVGCHGEASGAIGISVTGGTPPYNYAWAPNPSTDSVATGLVAGSYTVSVGDLNGCSLNFTDSIAQPDSIFPLITAASVIGGFNIACSGDTTGTAWAVVDSGGTPPFHYFWSNGATTDTVIHLGAGPLSVHIVDSNGCSIDVFDTLTQPEPVSANYSLSTYLGGLNVSCSGSSNGSIIQTIIGGGTPGYTYLWSPGGQTTVNDTGLFAGTYQVLITDTNGCKDSIMFVLTAPPPLTDSLVSPQTNGGWNISCNGGTDGSITVNVFGGTGPFAYSWSDGETTQTINNLGAGTYSVTVTDTNFCSVIDSITLTQPLPLADTISAKAYIGGNTISCFGFSDGNITVSVSGGTAPYSYSWNTGDTTDSLGTFSSVPIVAGTYIVNITDANGCSRTDSITLTQPDSISANAVVTPIACFGQTGCIALNPSGGAPGYKFFWTPTEDSTQTFCDTAGTYQVIITDTNFCVSLTSYTLTQPNVLLSSSAVSTFGGSNVSCNSTCDGTITVSVSGGTLPYTYTWSPNVSTDSTASGLCAGSYTITVTDSNSCSTVDTITLIAPPPLTGPFTTSVYAGGYNVSCAGNDGIITITPTGGTAPFTYVWTGFPAFTDSSESGLSAGLYVITITDANNCSVVDSVTLTQAVAFSFSDSLSSYNGYNVSCNGSTNGAIFVTLTGGVPPFTFHWSNGDTTLNLSNLGAGTYVDTIRFAGCMAIDSATITEPPVSSSSSSPGAACDSLVLPWDSTVTISGSYVHVYTNIFSCDSTVTFNVTINNSSSGIAPPVTACDSFAWNGTTYTTSGSVTHVFSGGNAVGCDSTATLSLTINYSSTGADAPVTACDSFAWNGTTYTTSGNVSHLFPGGNAVGCDSTATLALTINYSSFGTAAPVAACDSFVWNGTTYTAGGNVTHVFPGGNAVGCDSTATLPLTINHSSTSTAPPVTACDSYTWNGTMYTTSGSVIHVFAGGNGVGCDSTVTLPLTINYSSSGTAATITACDSYTWNGTTYTASGNVTHVFSGGNAVGCDSTATLPLTINYSSSSTAAAVTACDSYTWNGNTYTTSGNPTHTLTGGNAAGCDSTITLPLTINYSTSGSDAPATACDSYTWNGTVYTASGTQTHVFTLGNSVHCDSTATIDLTINYSSSPTLVTPAGCDSLVLPWDTTVIASGSFNHTYTNTVGCDSVVTADVTINYSAGAIADGGPNDSVCLTKKSSAMLHASVGSGLGTGVGSWTSLGAGVVTDPSDTTTGVTNLGNGNNLFLWVVTNGACATSADTVIIYVNVNGDCADSLWMPTGFSPNGDGSHDVFFIHGVEDQQYSLNSFKVFNRWGNEVFTADNYDNVTHVWAGQNKSGDPLPDGTYFAILVINNSSVQLHGYVDLRR